MGKEESLILPIGRLFHPDPEAAKKVEAFLSEINIKYNELCEGADEGAYIALNLDTDTLYYITTENEEYKIKEFHKWKNT